MQARAALAEKGIPYWSHSLSAGEKLPVYGGIPVLVDGSQAVVGALAIIEYVDTRWPEPPLFPICAGRQAVKSALRRVGEAFAPHLPRIELGAPSERADALRKVRMSMGDLDGEVSERGYLLTKFSAADLALASIVALLPPDWRPASLGYLRLGRWERTVMTRPAVREQMVSVGQ
jgi:glutathione S-transferase